MTDFDPQSIVDRTQDHAETSGMFESVNGHEPDNPPTVSGLTAAVWVDTFGPARRGSGLSTTNGLLVLNFRIYSAMIAEPADHIDPNMLRAAHLLLAAYHGDFEITDLKPGIDLLSRNGVEMRWRAGYLRQDAAAQRVYTLPIPIEINDLWDQAA